ncbi:MAG: 7-cyano-7-deazaguanine synthase, partial [Methanobacterium sp.]|nr:7-cyano-7-deazaguanine synthase [Methanobacterium sp.]
MESCIVLLSGGIDSAACISYYLDQDFTVKPVFINYGQVSAKYELQSAKKIVSYYDIDLKSLEFKQNKNFFQGEIKGRNAFLIFAILLYYPQFRGLISLGIHADSPYYDCSEFFLQDIKKLLDGYTNGQVSLDIPFLHWDKKMIYEYCKNNHVP